MTYPVNSKIHFWGDTWLMLPGRDDMRLDFVAESFDQIAGCTLVEHLRFVKAFTHKGQSAIRPDPGA